MDRAGEYRLAGKGYSKRAGTVAEQHTWEASQMEQWEYTSLKFFIPTIFAMGQWERFILICNEWGEQGWQLVLVVRNAGLATTLAIFKRRKPEGNTMPPAS